MVADGRAWRIAGRVPAAVAVAEGPELLELPKIELAVKTTRQLLEEARARLLALQPTAPAAQRPALEEAIERLSLVLRRLRAAENDRPEPPTP